MPNDDGQDGSGTGWAAVRWAEHQLAASGAGVGVPDGYVLDPERAQVTIGELTRITDEVRRFLHRASALAFDAPGYDAVSVNLANNGRVMADRATAFVRAWADQIEATRDALQHQLDAYNGVEDTNRDLLA
jgi:hypothetical protein